MPFFGGGSNLRILRYLTCCWHIVTDQLKFLFHVSLSSPQRMCYTIFTFIALSSFYLLMIMILLCHQAASFLVYRILIDVAHLAGDVLPAKLEYRGTCCEPHMLEQVGIF